MTFADEEQRRRWSDVLKPDFMSSEESAVDGGDEVLVVRCLPWRSPQVDQLLKKLDDKCFLEKKPLARRQTKRRVVGPPSDRPVPIGNIPGWALNKN